MSDYAEAVIRACKVKRPEWRPWAEVPEIDDTTDPYSGLPGTDSLSKAVKSHRCGFPLRSVWEKHGIVRYCTGLPLSRMGRGDKHTSRFCKHHAQHEPERATAPSEGLGEWAIQVFVLGETDPNRVEAAAKRRADA